MKRLNAVIIFLLLLILCIPFALNAEEKTDEINIVFTNDMHSHFDTEIINSDGSIILKGGFAKVSTIISQAKADDPNTLVLDSGDFSMGTLYQTIYTSSAPELNLMKFMGYDATTFGNHEFDYRAEGLGKMLKTAADDNCNIPIVICNIDWDATLKDAALKENAQTLKNAMDRYGVKDYIILNKGGIKIAVFGVIGKDAISCAPKSGLIFSDTIESAKKTVDEIKQKENPDLIICLSHSGTDEDKSKSEDELLAKAVPDIDVILSGHTHTTITQPIISGNTVICSTGSYTYNVGKLILIKDSNNNYSVKEYKLIDVNETVDDDTAVNFRIGKYKNLVNENYLSLFGYSFDQTLAVSNFAFTPIENFAKNLQEDGLGDLISDSYIYAVKNAEGENYKNVDVSVVPSGVIRGSFDKGPITVSEVYNTLSLGIGKDNIAGYPLVSIYLTGKELKAVAEVDASISTIMPDAQLYMSGLDYQYNTNRLFLNRVTDAYLIKDGQRVEIDDNKLYRVVSGLYSAQMLGAVKGKSLGLLSIIPKDYKGNAITDFENYIVYNKDNTEVKEWVALASYIQSFAVSKGGLVPQYYNQTHERKVEINSKNILNLIKNPNKVFFIALAAAVLILFIIIFIIVKTRKAIKRKKKK